MYRVEFGPHFIHWVWLATWAEAVKFARKMRPHDQVRILDSERREVKEWQTSPSPERD